MEDDYGGDYDGLYDGDECDGECDGKDPDVYHKIQKGDTSLNSRSNGLMLRFLQDMGSHNRRTLPLQRPQHLFCLLLPYPLHFH